MAREGRGCGLWPFAYGRFAPGGRRPGSSYRYSYSFWHSEHCQISIAARLTRLLSRLKTLLRRHALAPQNGQASPGHRANAASSAVTRASNAAYFSRRFRANPKPCLILDHTPHNVLTSIGVGIRSSRAPFVKCGERMRPRAHALPQRLQFQSVSPKLRQRQ
jgi:hypothetical protein